MPLNMVALDNGTPPLPNFVCRFVYIFIVMGFVGSIWFLLESLPVLKSKPSVDNALHHTSVERSISDVTEFYRMIRRPQSSGNTLSRISHAGQSQVSWQHWGCFFCWLGRRVVPVYTMRCLRDYVCVWPTTISTPGTDVSHNVSRDVTVTTPGIVMLFSSVIMNRMLKR